MSQIAIRFQLTITIFCSLFLLMSDFVIASDITVTSNTDKDSIETGVMLKANDTQFQLTQNYIEKISLSKEHLIYNPDYKSEIENTAICQYEKTIICDLFSFTKNDNHIQKVSQKIIDKKALTELVDNLGEQFNSEPENAKFQTEDGKISVFSLGEDGIKIDKEKSIKMLEDYFKNDSSTKVIELPYEITKPEISSDSANDLGINSLIGEGKSNFSGSTKNRIFNINVAIKKFDGLIIKSGEEFSFVKTLGEVDGETGYLPELVIKKDKTELDFGGGVCQVSTTAFRAAVYSGLKITARRNHAYPVSYYNPQGFDSTVYVPYPDLRFINNTPGNILIQAKIVGSELSFQFYGTDDGRKTELTGPTILEKNPDGSMKTTLSQKVFTSNGEILIDDVFNSSYESPNKYPHPSDKVLTKKPADWSNKQWLAYKKENDL